MCSNEDHNSSMFSLVTGNWIDDQYNCCSVDHKLSMIPAVCLLQSVNIHKYPYEQKWYCLHFDKSRICCHKSVNGLSVAGEFTLGNLRFH